MSVLAWTVFGLIAGVVANALDPRPSGGGIVGAIILGLLGAMVGGVLANLLLELDVTSFNLTSFVTAIAGSLLLLYIGRTLRGV